MQVHLMHLNMKWSAALSPAQTPNDVKDQPVYTLTKELQFRHPEIFSHCFPIFGQLHIEQSLLVIHGQLIKGSGVAQILTENKFSLLGLSAVADVKAKYTLQITLCALYIKLSEAASVGETDFSPYDWLTEKSKDNTVFFVKVLLFVLSICEGNLELQFEVL